MLLEANAAPDLDQVLAANPPKLRVVPEQIRELGALLNEIEPIESGNTLIEVVDAEHLTQQSPGIVEAQRLVEIADQQVGRHRFLVVVQPNVPIGVSLHRMSRSRAQTR